MNQTEITPQDNQTGYQTPMDSYAVHGINETLPNSTGILVLGILSIVTCFCYGIPGLILAIIALAMGSKAKNLLESQPGRFSESSVKNYKAGKVCAIIGLVLSALFLVFVIIYVAMIGTLMTDPMMLREMFNN